MIYSIYSSFTNNTGIPRINYQYTYEKVDNEIMMTGNDNNGSGRNQQKAIASASDVSKKPAFTFGSIRTST